MTYVITFLKLVQNFLFRKLRVRDSRKEPHFPTKGKLLSSQIKINTLFENYDKIKRRGRDINIHKAMQITVEIYQKRISCLLMFNQKMHVNWNLQIIYGYHYLINISMTL